MGISIDFSVDGEKQLSVELGIMADHVTDWTPALEEASEILLKSFDLNFDSRGQLFQGGWPKRKVEKPWPLLENIGDMRRGFDSAIVGSTLTLGNTASYFKYHQSSAPRTSGLPRRIMMKIDDPRRREIVKIFQKYILSQGGSQR